MNPFCSPANREKIPPSPAEISVADAAASHSTKRSGRLHTVALVDDEEWDRMRGSQILVWSGRFHSVNLYASAEEALLGEIPGGQSQVVLMDVRMPKMSGLECARELRNLRPDLVIFLISGFEQPAMPGQALEAGADAYLTKPLSVGQLSEALTDCLRRRKLEMAETEALHAQTKETAEPAPLACTPLTLSNQWPGSASVKQESSAEPEHCLFEGSNCSI